jgi:hypothetical protein
MKLIEKKIHLVLLLSSFLFLAFFCKQGQSKELSEDPNKGKPFILVVYPRVVTIGHSNGVDSVLMLVNLGNKPISLGRRDPKTNSMVDGDYELRVSIDIGNAPVRYVQIGGRITASNEAPFTSMNLISGVKLKAGSGLWMTLTALPMENIEKPEGGDAKFTFTLLSLVNGKSKTLTEIGFSIRYETRKRSDDTTGIQASIGPDKQASNLEALK